LNPYAQSKANAYKSLEVTSSHRLKVVVMIYDAAIASLKQSIASHKRNDIVKRNQFISRTQFIIQELNNALDMQQGKEISSTLRKLYHFIIRHLGFVLTDNDIKKVNESLAILMKLREAWYEISQKAIKEDDVNKNTDTYHGEQKLNRINA